WGGVMFIGFNEASTSDDSFERTLAVVTSVGSSVIARCQEEIGAQKLAGVFKAWDVEAAKTGGIKEVMNLACILTAKGGGWQEAITKIITRTDRNSYYLSAMLAVL